MMSSSVATATFSSRCFISAFRRASSLASEALRAFEAAASSRRARPAASSIMSSSVRCSTFLILPRMTALRASCSAASRCRASSDALA